MTQQTPEVVGAMKPSKLAQIRGGLTIADFASAKRPAQEELQQRLRDALPDDTVDAIVRDLTTGVCDADVARRRSINLMAKTDDLDTIEPTAGIIKPSFEDIQRQIDLGDFEAIQRIIGDDRAAFLNGAVIDSLAFGGAAHSDS
jgi:hypothetical protein